MCNKNQNLPLFVSQTGKDELFKEMFRMDSSKACRVTQTPNKIMKPPLLKLEWIFYQILISLMTYVTSIKSPKMIFLVPYSSIVCFMTYSLWWMKLTLQAANITICLRPQQTLDEVIIWLRNDLPSCSNGFLTTC